MYRSIPRVLSLFLVLPVLAAPPPPVPITALIEQADVVVHGELQGISSVREGDWEHYSGVLRVRGVIIGDLPETGVVPVTWSEGPFLCNGFPALPNLEGVPAIWVLENEDSTYRLPHWDAVWPIADSYLVYPSAAEALARIQDEVVDGMDERTQIIVTYLHELGL